MGGDTKDTEDANPDSIALIGSGDFGRALALRMVQSGLTVNIGSRNPQRNRELVLKTGAKLTSVEEAIRASQSNIVILAVPKDFYEKQPIHLLEGKVVIDVSNRNSIYAKGESQAEYLQSMLPRSAVVKAFNVLSAYALESGGIQGSKEVFYAGDVHSAKEEVSGLIRTLGFSPIDRGALRNAREIEDIPVQRFPLWKTPLIISTVLFAVLFLLAFSKMQICWTLTWDSWKGWHWGRFETIPVTTINSTLAVHAITLLALCYLPGCIGAWIQIFKFTISFNYQLSKFIVYVFNGLRDIGRDLVQIDLPRPRDWTRIDEGQDLADEEPPYCGHHQGEQPTAHGRHDGVVGEERVVDVLLVPGEAGGDQGSHLSHCALHGPC